MSVLKQNLEALEPLFKMVKKEADDVVRPTLTAMASINPDSGVTKFFKGIQDVRLTKEDMKLIDHTVDIAKGLKKTSKKKTKSSGGGAKKKAKTSK